MDDNPSNPGADIEALDEYGIYGCSCRFSWDMGIIDQRSNSEERLD